MLRILIVLAAVVWLGLLLSGAGGGRLRPGLETARERGEAIVEIDPLHSAPLRGAGPDLAPGPAPDSAAGPAPVALPEAAPGTMAQAETAPGEGGRQREGAASDAGAANRTPVEAAEADDAVPERRRRIAPVFTLSDLPPAGQIEAIPRAPDDSGAAAGPDDGILPGFVALPESFADEAEARDEGDGRGGASGAGAYTVSADALNLRDAPSTEGAVLYRLERGDSVQVIAETGTGWAEVLTADGALRGFVSVRFLHPAP